MAQVLGECGRYLTDQVQGKRMQILHLLVVVVAALFTIEGFILASWLNVRRFPPWARLTTVLVVGILAFVIYRLGLHRLRRLDKEREYLRRGAEAESTVGRLLAELPDEFYLINDVASDNGNVDHVVVGPTGVFVLDTKSWRGVVSADGNGELLLNERPTEKPFVRQFIARMLRFRDRVRTLAPEYDPYYQPVFVFTSARVEAKWGTTSSVHCVREGQLSDYIAGKDFGKRLEPAETQRIAQAFLGMAYMEHGFTERMINTATPDGGRGG